MITLEQVIKAAREVERDQIESGERCQRGHLWSRWGVVRSDNGRRYCRLCKRSRDNKSKAARKSL